MQQAKGDQKLRDTVSQQITHALANDGTAADDAADNDAGGQGGDGGGHDAPPSDSRPGTAGAVAGSSSVPTGATRMVRELRKGDLGAE